MPVHTIFMLTNLFLSLQYELEREKLEMELEEERKSHKERELHTKLDNLSNLSTFSDADRNSSQV